MEAPLLLPLATASSSSSAAAAESPSSSPSNASIVARVVAVLAVASVSLFAQHEASRGFHIDVVNAAPRDTVAGRRFDLFFVSNGRAERVLHYASRGVEEALFPDASFPRKRVTRVTVKMAGHNLTGDDGAVAAASVDGVAPGEYVISLSPGLMYSTSDKAADAVAAAVRRAVARMWLWDGRGAAPARVTEAMVDYLASGANANAIEASPAADDNDAPQCMSARFLTHLERRRGGFVARLNRAMRDRWSDAAVDAALGVPARPACAAYRAAAAAALTQQQPPAALAGSTSAGDDDSRVAM
ncbi:uncharacterized protein LOC102721084 [Oryza brachyantha]|uniref:uncharacterized protein LOC102721084 n=1 Tax=Oryza brachyantha TaxID=4533 RepID=UPI001ADCDEA3|nr:uncharacterized protein LOC102721084 [Oryza brachyantha]